MLILEHEKRLADLNASIKMQSMRKEGSSVVFATRLKTDTDKRNESEIERTKAAIFTGSLENYTIEIQASLVCMVSENAWRRLESRARSIAGFGTLIGVDAKSLIVEIDPIAFGYIEVD